MKILFIVLLISTSVISSETSLQLQRVHNACVKGVATACFELGELYKDGMGVDSNTSQAYFYYQLSCNYGFSTACQALKIIKNGALNGQ